MTKILFVNPIIREEDNPKHIPYGIALLASIAIDNGHQVQIYDANAWRKDFSVLEDVYKADDWDVIAIGSLTTAYAYIKDAFHLAKKVSPNSLMMAGGGFITSMPHDMMAMIPEIDLALIGESFVTLPEALLKIDKKDFDFSNILGVCYRDSNGKSHLTDARPTIHDLDALPYPAWDLLPLDIYFNNSQMLYSEAAFLSKRRIDINGSYGCNLICKFCWHLGTTGDMLIEKNDAGENDVRFSYGRSIRYHSPRYIVNMVKELQNRYQIDFASFIDENLMTMDAFSKRKWIFELCDLWIAEGLQPQSRKENRLPREGDTGVFWSGTSHATLHRPETLKRMYEAGCSHLVYGIESFDPIVLKNLGKGTSVRANKEAVKMCMDSGIIPIPNIMIGFPEETFQSVRNTIEALIELGIYAKPHFATPYPGSEWYYAYLESILEQYNGDLESFIKDLGDASKITAVISHNYSGLQLLGLQQIVMNRDLRLLDQAEKHWGKFEANINPIAVPKESFNIIKKKVAGPAENFKRENFIPIASI